MACWMFTFSNDGTVRFYLYRSVLWEVIYQAHQTDETIAVSPWWIAEPFYWIE